MAPSIINSAVGLTMVKENGITVRYDDFYKRNPSIFLNPSAAGSWFHKIE